MVLAIFIGLAAAAIVIFIIFLLPNRIVFREPKITIGALAVIVLVLLAIFLFPFDGPGFGRVGGEAREFDIVIHHTSYEPNRIAVMQGDLVRLNLRTEPGTGAYMHGLTIDEYGINKLVTSETSPEVVAFVADKKGTFSAYCGTCLNGPFGADVPDKRLTLIVS